MQGHPGAESRQEWAGPVGKSVSVVAMERNVQGSQAEGGLAMLEISTPWIHVHCEGSRT